MRVVCRRLWLHNKAGRGFESTRRDNIRSCQLWRRRTIYGTWETYSMYRLTGHDGAEQWPWWRGKSRIPNSGRHRNLMEIECTLPKSLRVIVLAFHQRTVYSDVQIGNILLWWISNKKNTRDFASLCWNLGSQVVPLKTIVIKWCFSLQFFWSNLCRIAKIGGQLFQYRPKASLTTGEEISVQTT